VVHVMLFAELSEELVCAGDGVVVFFSELSEKLACGGGVGCSEGGVMLEDCWHAAVARHAPVFEQRVQHSPLWSKTETISAAPQQ